MSMPRVWLEAAWSMARVCLEYAYSMPRVCLETKNLFPYGEQNIPTLGTKHSQPGNKTGFLRPFSSKRAELERRLLVSMLLMLTLGTVSVWGQSPVEITTDTNENGTIEESEKKFYLIQTNAFPSFYIAPQANNTITTNNILGEYMLWYFLDAGKDNPGTDNEIQYYYIVNNSTGKYICNTSDRSIQIVSLSDDNKEKCKFKFVVDNEDGTTGFYNIDVKANQTYFGLNKQSGSANDSNPIRLTNNDYIHDSNSKWKFVPFNGTYVWPTPPFTPSTDSDKHFYKIHNKKSDAYYVSTDATSEKVTFASTASDRMVWYLKEAGSDTWFKYYYLVNPAADDKYMFYDGTLTNGKEQTDAVSVKAHNSENEEDRYQFVVLQAARGDGASRVECYAIIPKKLLGNLWTSNSIGPKSISDGANMGIIKSRGDTNAHWTFESTTLDPVITCDETGTVTITCEDGAEVYYTTNGDTPTETETDTNKKYNASSKPTVTAGKTTIKAIAINSEQKISNVVTKSIVLNPTITLTSESYTYTGSAQNPIGSVDYVDEGNSGNSIHFETTQYTVSYKKGDEAIAECQNVGTYTIILNDVGGDDYIVCGTGNFTISKTPLTVTAKPKTIIYGEGPSNDGVTYTGFVGGESESVLSGELAYNYTYSQYGDVGDTYTITPTGLTSSNYEIAFVAGTLTVNQKEVVLTWTHYDDLVYNGSAQKPTCELTGIVNGDDVSVSVAGEKTNAGSYTATASLMGAKVGNYKLPTLATRTFEIAKKTVTVTSGITANNKVYDGTTDATFDCSSAVVTGLLGGDALEVTSATGTFADKNVGEGKTVTITGFTMGGTSGDNYQAAETGNQTSSTANITQLEAVLTWSSVALTYNATAQTPTVTVENAAEGDNVTVTVTGEQTNVGENYTATVTALSDTNYKLPAEGLTRNFTIAPAELAVTADAQTKVYGDDDPTTLTYTATGLLGSDAITGALVRTEGNNVGEYDISQGTLAASNNYTIAFTGAKFTITAAPLNITADNKSKTNGDADPELTYTVTGLKYGESKEAVLEGSLTREAGEDNGSYAINQGTLALKEGNNNYTISFTAGTFTINAKPLTLTVNLEDWVYGSPNTPSVSGNVSGGKVTYSYKYQNQGDDKYTTTKPKAQGSYTVRAQVPATGGYEEATATKNFKINKLALVITADAKQKEYLDEDPKLTYTANLQYDDKLENVVNCVLERTAGENVGVYAITKKSHNVKSSNYSFGSYNGNNLTITVKNLGDGGTPTSGITISANKVESSWTVKLYNGKNEFNASDFTYAESGSDTEGYTITVTGQGNNCCGSATATYNHTIFDSPIIVSSTEKAIPYYVADKDVKTSVDVVPCIVSQVNTSVGTISITPISYIPEGVPVLLLAKNEVTGLTSSPLNEGESSISESLLSSNKLMYSAEETVDVHDAEAYLYYKNEFVLTLEGTIKAQNYYIYNPNYTGESGSSTSSNPAPSRTLSILKGSGTTGIMDLNFDKAKEDTGDRWYSLDGRRLNGKPSQKGIYIKNGKKTVVK